jgi:hypothetical protein
MWTKTLGFRGPQRHFLHLHKSKHGHIKPCNRVHTFFNLDDERKIMVQKHFPKGLDDRQRDQDGEIRQKRSDTLVRTLRNEYGQDFAKGYRSDTKLDTVLKQEGVESLHQLFKKQKYELEIPFDQRAWCSPITCGNNTCCIGNNYGF